MNDASFFDHMDQMLRIGASQFRALKLSQVDYMRFARKSTQKEKEDVDEVLDMIVLDEDSLPPTQIAKQPTTPVASSSSKKIEESPTQDLFDIGTDFFKKFQSPEKKEETSCTDMVLYQGSQPTLKRGFAKSNLDFDGDENQEAKRPLLRRQLAKSSFDLDTQNLQTLALALETKTNHMETTPKKPCTPRKKAKAKSKVKAAGSSKGGVDEHKSKGKAKPKSKPKGSTPYKTTFRHRKTSSAYHSAKHDALKAGISPKSAKIKGKEASAKVARQIDMGVLKEN